MATYLRLAGEISQGGWPDHFDYQPLYYSVFLPFCRMLGGDGISAAIVLQLLLGVGAVYLVILSGSRLFGRWGGALGGLLLALSQMHAFFTPFMLYEVLQSFWVSLILYVGVKNLDWKKAWVWLALGGLIGVSALTRGNAALYLPGALALAVYRLRRGGWLRAIGVCVGMALLFEAVHLPFSLVNYRYMGRWCGASTAGGKVLALGNTPEAPPGGLEYPLTYHKWVAQAEARNGEEHMGMAENILGWARREPLVFAEQKMRALLLFWDRREIANNISLGYDGRNCGLLKALVPFSVIGSLAVLGGLWLGFGAGERTLRWNAGRLFFSYMLVCSWFGTALFYNLERFRVSVLPLICVLGGAGLVWLGRVWERREKMVRDEWLGIGLRVLASVFIVCFAFSAWQEQIETRVQRACRPNGLLCEFSDTRLVYDHGPLSVGGFGFWEVPVGGMEIRKTIKGVTGWKNAVVRLPVIGGSGFSGRLSHGGRDYYFNEKNVRTDRFLHWVEVKLDQVTDDVFIFHLPQGCGYGMDTLRRYGRTTLITPQYEETPAAEAAVEVQEMK